MTDWTLDELAVSFIENSFWPQEALMVVEEELYGTGHRIVVEGNRRLAALKLLFNAKEGRPASPKWADLAAGCSAAKVRRSFTRPLSESRQPPRRTGVPRLPACHGDQAVGAGRKG